MRRDALPCSVWHLYPDIGPARMHIHGLALCIGAFCIEHHAGDCRAFDYGDVQVAYIDTGIFRGLRIGQRLCSVANRAVGARAYQFV